MFRYYSRKVIPAILVFDIIPKFRLDIVPLDTITFSLTLFPTRHVEVPSGKHVQITSKTDIRLFQKCAISDYQ